MDWRAWCVQQIVGLLSTFAVEDRRETVSEASGGDVDRMAFFCHMELERQKAWNVMGKNIHNNNNYGSILLDDGLRELHSAAYIAATTIHSQKKL